MGRVDDSASHARLKRERRDEDRFFCWEWRSFVAHAISPAIVDTRAQRRDVEQARALPSGDGAACSNRPNSLIWTYRSVRELREKAFVSFEIARPIAMPERVLDGRVEQGFFD